MKQKIILSIILVYITINIYPQSSLLDTLNMIKSKNEVLITKRIKKQFGKEARNKYNHFLLIPRLELKNLDITVELYLSKEKGDTIIKSILKNPTDENLRIKPDNCYYQILIYDDSLNILGSYVNRHIYRATYEDEALLRYYSTENISLIYYIGWMVDYFALIDNKIWMLKYDSETKTFTKIEL